MKQPKKSSTLFARVDPDLKAEFKTMCREAGTDESALIRAMAAAAVALPRAIRAASLHHLLKTTDLP